MPAWVEYRYGALKSIQVPFDTYFRVDPLKKIHKVVTMETFMKKIAPVEWPENKRISFCYMARGDYKIISLNQVVVGKQAFFLLI